MRNFWKGQRSQYGWKLTVKLIKGTRSLIIEDLPLMKLDPTIKYSLDRSIGRVKTTLKCITAFKTH